MVGRGSEPVVDQARGLAPVRRVARVAAGVGGDHGDAVVVERVPGGDLDERAEVPRQRLLLVGHGGGVVDHEQDVHRLEARRGLGRLRRAQHVDGDGRASQRSAGQREDEDGEE
jgi:hypothetical protein